MLMLDLKIAVLEESVLLLHVTSHYATVIQLAIHLETVVMTPLRYVRKLHLHQHQHHHHRQHLQVKINEVMISIHLVGLGNIRYQFCCMVI